MKRFESTQKITQKEMRAQVREECLEISKICKDLKGLDPEFTYGTKHQGTKHLVSPDITADSFTITSGPDPCNKYVSNTVRVIGKL